MKIELHVHTSKSLDATIKIKEIENYLAHSDIDMLAVCDHKKPVSKTLVKNPRIIPGIEFSCTRGEIIGLFINEPFESTNIRDIIQHIHRLGGLVMIPHPFRNTRARWQDLISEIDLFEIYNPRLSRHTNDIALDFALTHQLTMVVGSDAHLPSELGSTQIEIKGQNLSLRMVKKALRLGYFQISRISYSLRSEIWYSKLIKNYRRRKILHFLYQTLRFIHTKLTELPPNYRLNKFNTDQLQIKLDSRYQYGETWFWRLHHRQRINRIFKILKKLPKGSIKKTLDAGCGRGVYAQFLAKEKYQVTAIDFSQTEIFWAKNFSDKKIKFLVGDIENLPFPDESFDLVVCSEVIEHLRHPFRGFEEILRVLKREGYLLISLPNASSFYWQRCKFLAYLAGLLKKDCQEILQHTKWPISKINQLFDRDDLKTVEISGTYLILGEPLILKIMIKYFPFMSAFMLKIDQIASNSLILKNFDAFHIRLMRKVNSQSDKSKVKKSK